MSNMIKRFIFERVSENIITKPWMAACYRDYQRREIVMAAWPLNYAIQLAWMLNLAWGRYRHRESWIDRLIASEARLKIIQLERERDEARAKVERQAERICQLEGATNHAGGTPLSIALRERDEAKADAARIADKLSGLELRSTEEMARLEQERNEARAVADELASVAAHCLGWHDHKSPAAAIKIAAALKRWKKSK